MTTLDKYIFNPTSGKAVLDTPARRAELISKGLPVKKLNPSEYTMSEKGNPIKIKTKKKTIDIIEEDTEKPYLPTHILEKIATHANSATKKTLKQTNKHFRNTTKVKPDFGKINYDNLIKYIKTSPDGEKTSKLYLMDWKGEGPKEHIDFLKEEIDGRPDTKRLTITKNLKKGKPIIIGTQEYTLNDTKFKLNIIKKHQPYFIEFLNDKLVHVNMNYQSQINEQYSFIMNNWNDQLTPNWNKVLSKWRIQRDIEMNKTREQMAEYRRLAQN